MSTIPLSETAAKRRIGDILLEHGFVTEAEIADATLEQERTQQPLGQILVGRGAITRLELASALAEQWSDPAASILASVRTPPAPASTPVLPPSAQDEAEYAARLQEAVADLARKVQSNTPLEGIDERVDELARRIEGTLARTQHIEAAVATLAESLEGVTTGVEEAFSALQNGTAELVGDLTRIEQTVGELAAREDSQGNQQSLADLEELRSAVAALSAGDREASELRAELDGISARLTALSESGSEAEAALRRVEGVVAGLEDLRAIVAERQTNPEAVPDLEDRIDRIEVVLAESSVGTAELGSRIESLADRISEDRGADPRVEDVLARLERLDALLERTRSESEEVGAERLGALEARLDGLVRAEDQTRALAARFVELEDALAHRVVTPAALASALDVLRSERDVDDELAARLDALEGRVPGEFVTPEALARALESHTSTELVGRFDTLEARLADGVVSPDALARAIEAALSEAPAPPVAERVTELDAEVAALRAEIAAAEPSASTPGDNDRLVQLESRIEHLAQSPSDLDAIVSRLDDMESARRRDRDAANALAAAVDRLRHERATAERPAGGGTQEVLDAIAAQNARLEALESAPPAQPTPSGEDPRLVSELERVRLVLERVGLHLAEHDRALADLGPSRGAEERLQELIVLVHDLAEVQQNGSIAHATDGPPASVEMGALLQRVEEAEASAQTDNEKLMNRLERMASSIDWRLQRLESAAEGDAG